MKAQIQKLVNRLPKPWTRRLYWTAVSLFGADQSPVYNMYHHIANLKKLGFKPDLIIDGGAYVGDWTKSVRKIYPDATFVMVEAQPAKRVILQAVASEFDNVNFEIALLGDAEKEMDFFEMETGSSIYEENTNYDRQKTTLMMHTLDSVADKYRKPESCFIKLDVQGAEIDILKGAPNLLTKTDFILLEISTLNYNENAPQFFDVILFMKNIGFVVFDIADERRTHDGILFQTDLIFVKESSPFRRAVDFKR
ncbi:FkbM family methyltransferase [Mucilaginibacter myungsuensis]|uniref:FkbM family methyltransferase n=1 Tax=Mucilaginibacter myungsuensis TaxID=649104 RepID=A0A929L6K1_9SPHI|nr:FkbM family methyltransferase [Mucilaginibacter myungsuensis]MBE9664126.1 FkbM family methyltransferase [Mucilaginibacter myungsuensis]MDN3601305.1 FkbM family methyltransferase [Mucilaginibacter myungsuensis]